MTAPTANRPPLRVLLVEDDPGDAYLVTDLLGEAGRDVSLSVAESLKEVLHTGTLRGADCVLLDLNLPGVTGLDGLRKLLDDDPTAAVCVLTGLDDEYLGTAAVAMGAQDYLIKGKVDGPLLIRAIRYAVERRRAEGNLLRLREAELVAAESARVERGLLPRLLLDGTEIAAQPFYRSGRKRAVLGGDFYDAVRCPDGSVHAIVGDVCGHGPDEAALGAMLRVSWRAIALSGVGEPKVLPTLQQVLVSERHNEGLFTTVCTVALQEGRATVRIAGHPPPIMVWPDVEATPCPIGLPLGIESDAEWETYEFDLPESWAMLLHTDGLIEGSGPLPGDLLWQTGLLEIVDQERGLGLAALPGRLAERAELLNGGPLADDVAILLLSSGSGAAR
jgi:serine phosphatase RsbU (regulator of sigma subunit)